MDAQLVGWLSLGLLLLLIALRVPVAFSMGITGIIGYVLVTGPLPAFSILGTIPYAKIAKYTYTVIPLFMLMGHFADQAGFVTDIFNTARKWLGRLPGGMAHATVVGSAAFGACCGSGLAACAILGKVTIPEMLHHGVDRKLAFGTVAAAATLVSMIPPSNLMVIYGIITDTSVAKLLIAGIIPGIVAALCYMILIFIMVQRNPKLAPAIKETITWKDRFISLKGIWGIVSLAVIVMGGIYTGVFTPTEAGGVGAFCTFIIALGTRRLKWSKLGSVLLETTKTTGMIFFIIACSSIFANFLTITHIPTQVSEFLIALQVNRYIVLAGVMLLYLILGTFMDSISFMILTLPIIFPAMLALGFNPIWFGVLMILQAEIATVTPPFALNIFILKGVVPDSTVGEIVRGVLPFIIAMIFILVLYIVFPQFSLWLPSMMR